VNLNIFSPIKRTRKRAKDKDSFDRLIDDIERFAPGDCLSQREVYYYNYKMMDAYKRPLLELLETAAERDRFRTDPDIHARQLFLKLKAFYDVKDRLSIKEAMEDVALIRRFRDLLIYFYDRRDVSGDDIRDWLKNLT